MGRAVMGAKAALAARLKVAVEWMGQSSLPMLLVSRHQAWQANAAMRVLLQTLEQTSVQSPVPTSLQTLQPGARHDASAPGNLLPPAAAPVSTRPSTTPLVLPIEGLPPALLAAVAEAQTQDRPAPVHDCPLGTSGSTFDARSAQQPALQPRSASFLGDLHFVRIDGATLLCTVTDIGPAARASASMETAASDLQAQLIRQVPAVLFQLNMTPAGLLTVPFISAMSTELFQLDPAQIQENICLLLERVHRRDRRRLRQAMRESARTLAPWRVECRVAMGQQGWCWRELAARPLRRADGSIGWHGFSSDISGRKRAEETIRAFKQTLGRCGHYDALTGLPNRVLFRDRLEQALRHAALASRCIALLLIDLDRFKEINDAHGHAGGDNLLRLAGERIGAVLGPGDTLARLGGDEFAVLLSDTSEPVHSAHTAQGILDALRQPYQLGDGAASLAGSIGISLYPGDGRQPEQLMRHADQALARAKADGRDRLMFFEPVLQRAAVRRLKLSSELRQALDAGQFELLFQPILDNQTGLVSKAEALLRWRRPGRDLMAPGEFIGIAEETGLIKDIGDWVFYRAAHWSARWSRLLGRTLQISINQSARQFEAPGGSDDWIAYLDRCGLPHNSIALELSETALAQLSAPVSSRLHALHRGGMEVSIDDFGTGYSSMPSLKRLDIDYLKIDRSFVAAMLHRHSSLTMIESIIVMAHKLGLKVIAEGVETTAQRACLSNHGCDYVQGFLFTQPLPASAFEKLLLRQPFH